MGGASYIGSRLGDGLIFEVLLLQLETKERPGKLVDPATVDFSPVQAQLPIESEGGLRYFTMLLMANGWFMRTSYTST